MSSYLYIEFQINIKYLHRITNMMRFIQYIILHRHLITARKFDGFIYLILLTISFKTCIHHFKVLISYVVDYSTIYLS